MTKRANKVIPLRPTAAESHTATVVRAEPGVIEIEIGGERRPAALATHVPAVAAGQRVLAVSSPAETDWLIVAAWPIPGEAAPSDSAPGPAPKEPITLDPATGTLHVHAARIDLTAVASIELTCGETSIRLGVDGRVSINGNEISSSALGAHRIEGGSVDIN